MDIRPIRLLLIEDNPGDARLIQEMLHGLSVVQQVVERLTDGVRHLEQHDVDVVVLDLGLPDSQGLDTLRVVHQAAPQVPIVVLTGRDDEETGQAAVREGAQDYVTKGNIGETVLSRAIRYAIERNEHLVKSEHLNRVLRALRTVNQLIAIERDPDRLLEEACAQLVDARGYVGSWALSPADNGTGPRFAHAGGEGRYDALSRAVEQGFEPLCCRRAVVSDKGVVVMEPETDCRECPLASSGCGSGGAVAVLRHRERNWGFLGVSTPKGFVFDDNVLAEVARDLAFALHSISVEQERRKLQAKLAQSDRLATMGMLAAGVAHEINNPLSYVLFNLQSLMEDLPALSRAMRASGPGAGNSPTRRRGDGFESDETAWIASKLEDAVDRAKEAFSGAERIRHISRGLLTFSRVESSEIGPVNLHEAIEHAIAIAYNEVKYRARLVKDFAAIPAVLGSDGKLAQVFLNLIVNAAHAIDEGRVDINEIRIRTWTREQWVFAEVADTGKGIALEDQVRIFEPFFTTKGIGVGSGLGLSICQTIVTSFGGQISFESKPGCGSRFRVQLPPVPAEWTASHMTARGDENAPTAHIRGRVLVVDDEPGLRRAIERILGQEHDVIVAASGEIGKSILERDPNFDVLFFDLMMPELSGMDLHAWLADQRPALAARVVFMSGGAFTPKGHDYLATVDNLRIEKPFEAKNLRKLTAEFVVAARAKAASSRPAAEIPSQ